MNEKVAAATLTVVSAGAGLSLLLPSAETAREAQPSDPDFRGMLRSGGTVYGLAVVSLATLQAVAVGSALPLIAGVALVTLVLGLLENHRRSGMTDAYN